MAMSIRIAIILLLLASVAQGTTYYMNASATGANNGGAGNDAWQTWTQANTDLHALADDGAGDTVIVSTGDYGDIADGSVCEATRTDWLTIQADTGATVTFDTCIVKRTSVTAGDIYLKFDGIQFVPTTEAYTFDLQYCHNVTFENCYFTSKTWDYGGPYSPFVSYYTLGGIGIFCACVDDLTVTDCEFEGVRRGIWGSHPTGGEYFHDWTISGCAFHRCGEDGVYVDYMDGLTVEDCQLYDFNHEYTCWYFVGSLQNPAVDFVQGELCTQATTGITAYYHRKSDKGDHAEFFQATATAILANTYNWTGNTSGAVWVPSAVGQQAHEDGIGSHYAVSNWIIQRNEIKGPGVLQAITYSPEYGGSNALIENNLIYDMTESGDKGIYLTRGTGIKCNNNTVYGTSGIGIYIRTYGTVMVVDEMFNNIAYTLLVANESGGSITITSHDNNIWGNDPTGALYTPNANEEISYAISNLFVDYANDDFNLPADSDAVDAANDSYGPDYDLHNNPRIGTPDIGALEYIAAGPPPAPEKATGPSPSNGATNQLTTTDLSWDAAVGADTYDVYWASHTPLLAGDKVSSAQAGTTYDPGALLPSTIYYWRIDTTNVTGTTTGDEWSFTTLGNRFSHEGNCIAVYRFENGALTTDSKGTNTLTVVNAPVADTVNYREGAASVDLELDSSQCLYRADADLSADFPLKSGTTNYTMSITTWVKPESITGVNSRICAKGDAWNGTETFNLYLAGGDDLYLSVNPAGMGTLVVDWPGVTDMSAGNWYFIAVTLTLTDNWMVATMHIWDLTNNQSLGGQDDPTGKSSGEGPPQLTDDPFSIGAVESNPWALFFDGLIDEFTVWNKVLTRDEIDEIRGGEYVPSGAQIILTAGDEE
jgi:hypothetical protein